MKKTVQQKQIQQKVNTIAAMIGAVAIPPAKPMPAQKPASSVASVTGCPSIVFVDFSVDT